jgi:hypothetical protein
MIWKQNGESRKVIDFNEEHAQALIAIALKVKTRKH